MLEFIFAVVALRAIYCTATRLWMREAANIMRGGWWHDPSSGQKLLRRERVISNPTRFGPIFFRFGSHWVAKSRDEFGTSYAIPRSKASVRRQIHATLEIGSTCPQDVVLLRCS